MQNVFFNVFDGEKVNKVLSENLAEFIQKCGNTVSVCFSATGVPQNVKSRIKLTPSKKNWIMKTNVKAKSCVVPQRRIVAIAKNHKRRIFSNIAECSRELNIDDSNISKVLKGKRTTAKGYKFEYV